MFLRITTTHRPATDLGFLLGKHPDRLQSFELAYGQAHVFFPEATEARCSACLVLDVDPVGLVRNHRGGAHDATLARYVNDRPYVASSFLSVAIARVLGSALGGVCKARPELAATAIPLVVELAAVPSRGGERFLRALFEPLGYEVDVEPVPLDEQFPAWGHGPYLRVVLRRTAPLAEVLGHVYVLLPVLDNYKHYWVDQAELEKLLDYGAGWLAAHPACDEIVSRYLKHQRRLTREALARLLADDEPEPEPEPDPTDDAAPPQQEAAIEARVSLGEARMAAVCAELDACGARSVIDLGCGEGRLVARLLRSKQLTRIAGADVSPRALEIAAERLRLDTMPERQRERLSLFQASLTYRDARFAGFDAACAIEVIEHLEPSRLDAFERVVFALARPPTVILTTPNAEYNARFAGLPAGAMRHRDHRFEWTRAEFARWAHAAAERHGYAVRLAPIGDVDPELGPPTQMGVFSRC
jgi:3' terminal RNA ribose 2'-O-methyltransferase Hen1